MMHYLILINRLEIVHRRCNRNVRSKNHSILDLTNKRVFHFKQTNVLIPIVYTLLIKHKSLGKCDYLHKGLKYIQTIDLISLLDTNLVRKLIFHLNYSLNNISHIV